MPQRTLWENIKNPSSASATIDLDAEDDHKEVMEAIFGTSDKENEDDSIDGSYKSPLASENSEAWTKVRGNRTKRKPNNPGTSGKQREIGGVKRTYAEATRPLDANNLATLEALNKKEAEDEARKANLIKSIEERRQRVFEPITGITGQYKIPHKPREGTSKKETREKETSKEKKLKKKKTNTTTSTATETNSDDEGTATRDARDGKYSEPENIPPELLQIAAAITWTMIPILAKQMTKQMINRGATINLSLNKNFTKGNQPGYFPSNRRFTNNYNKRYANLDNKNRQGRDRDNRDNRDHRDNRDNRDNRQSTSRRRGNASSPSESE